MELEKFYLNQPEKYNHVLLNNLKNILLFIINLFLHFGLWLKHIN